MVYDSIMHLGDILQYYGAISSCSPVFWVGPAGKAALNSLSLMVPNNEGCSACSPGSNLPKTAILGCSRAFPIGESTLRQGIWQYECSHEPEGSQSGKVIVEVVGR
jgi:hypothetical protein